MTRAADAAAANPFRSPRLHPGIGFAGVILRGHEWILKSPTSPRSQRSSWWALTDRLGRRGGDRPLRGSRLISLFTLNREHLQFAVSEGRAHTSLKEGRHLV